MRHRVADALHHERRVGDQVGAAGALGEACRLAAGVDAAFHVAVQRVRLRQADQQAGLFGLVRPGGSRAAQRQVGESGRVVVGQGGAGGVVGALGPRAAPPWGICTVRLLPVHGHDARRHVGQAGEGGGGGAVQLGAPRRGQFAVDRVADQGVFEAQPVGFPQHARGAGLLQRGGDVGAGTHRRERGVDDAFAQNAGRHDHVARRLVQSGDPPGHDAA